MTEIPKACVRKIDINKQTRQRTTEITSLDSIEKMRLWENEQIRAGYRGTVFRKVGGKDYAVASRMDGTSAWYQKLRRLLR